jgi:hypothetical protein
MRSSLHKGRKVFECLVSVLGLDDRTWITKDQLKISPSPMLVAKLKYNSMSRFENLEEEVIKASQIASSPYPLSQAQRDALILFYMDINIKRVFLSRLIK